MRVLRVGELDPSLAEILATKYHALVLPTNNSRTEFLAEHAASVRVIVEGGSPDVDATLMNALPTPVVVPVR